MRTGYSALVVLGAILLGPISQAFAEQDSVLELETLTGDWGGVRKQWLDLGVEFGLAAVVETLSNPIGGVRQLTIYDGLITPSLKLDLRKIVNWPGASFYVDGYQISGRGLTRYALGNNPFTVSSIEALASTRLHDLWLQQEFIDGQVSLRAGQIALDDEFYISQYSAFFVNQTFGCPDILGVDLPSGGPCYPFATPGARLRAAPTAALTFSAAAFNGNPAPPGPGDPQIRNSSGTNFLIGQGGSLILAEATYSFDPELIAGQMLSDVKLGGWYHTATFPDLRRDTLGRSLADPSGNGIAASHGGNFGLYFVLDKMIWREPKTATQGLAAFLRIGGAPPNRNLVSLEVDAGLTYKGLFPGREFDILGMGVSYRRIGNAARRFDRDEILFTGLGGPVRDYEHLLEITYQARLTPWWFLQPDLQLIFHPGGRIAALSSAPAMRPISNALVVGLRSSVPF